MNKYLTTEQHSLLLLNAARLTMHTINVINLPSLWDWSYHVKIVPLSSDDIVHLVRSKVKLQPFSMAVLMLGCIGTTPMTSTLST